MNPELSGRHEEQLFLGAGAGRVATFGLRTQRVLSSCGPGVETVFEYGEAKSFEDGKSVQTLVKLPGRPQLCYRRRGALAHRCSARDNCLAGGVLVA